MVPVGWDKLERLLLVCVVQQKLVVCVLLIFVRVSDHKL